MQRTDDALASPTGSSWSIACDAEPATEPPDNFTYDPANPVPFITDASFAQIGGPDDYRKIEERNDVLVYTSELLTEDVEVCGPIKVRLSAASSARDTDFSNWDDSGGGY